MYEEDVNRVKTGIQDLDQALHGGIPQGNIVLISGGAGTGKSTLSLQFLINGAMQFGEKGLYISTEQNRAELLRLASGFKWDLEGLEQKNQLKIMYFDITTGTGFLRQLKEVVSAFQPTRIVIDSLTTLTDSLLVSSIGEGSEFSMVQIAESVSPIPRTEQIVSKSILYSLFKELKKFEVTTILTSELPEDHKKLSADGVSEFVADGVLVMHYLGIGASQFRSLLIRKMRYSSHKKEIIKYEFNSNGINIIKDQELDF